MRPVPDWLPKANSRKWHNRRWWDGFGYYRARTLANPGAPRDTQSILNYLKHEPYRAENTELVDKATRLTHAYEGLKRGSDDTQESWDRRRDDAWDGVLEAIDNVLEVTQVRHMRGVIDGGASGLSEDTRDG